MRVVLDPNVIASATLSPAGPPAEIIRRWLDGEFELVVSPALLGALRRVLAYPKIAKLVPPEDAGALVGLLEAEAEAVADPAERGGVDVADPGDEYLIALAASAGAPLVSGDGELTAIAARFPVFAPASFLAALEDATFDVDP